MWCGSLYKRTFARSVRASIIIGPYNSELVKYWWEQICSTNPNSYQRRSKRNILFKWNWTTSRNCLSMSFYTFSIYRKRSKEHFFTVFIYTVVLLHRNWMREAEKKFWWRRECWVWFSFMSAKAAHWIFMCIEADIVIKPFVQRKHIWWLDDFVSTHSSGWATIQYSIHFWMQFCFKNSCQKQRL